MRIDINLQRQRGDGLVEAGAPELVAQRGKDQRRGFSGHARKGQHAAGDDSRRCGLHGDGKHRSPVGNAQAQRRFAHRVRHHQQHLFGGAADGGNHHDAQRHAAGREPKSASLRHDDERVDGKAHHDRGNAVEHVGGEADGVGQLGAAAELGQIDAAANADGNADETGNAEQHCRADDGIGHAAALFADRLGNLREEGEIQRSWRP